MKKSIVLLFTVAVTLFAACKKDDTDIPTPEQKPIVGQWYLRNLTIKTSDGTTTADNDYTGTTYNARFDGDGVLVAYVTHWDDYSSSSTWELLSNDTQVKLANGPNNKTYEVVQSTSSALIIKQPLISGNINSLEKTWTFSK